MFRVYTYDTDHFTANGDAGFDTNCPTSPSWYNVRSHHLHLVFNLRSPLPRFFRLSNQPSMSHSFCLSLSKPNFPNRNGDKNEALKKLYVKEKSDWNIYHAVNPMHKCTHPAKPYIFKDNYLPALSNTVKYRQYNFHGKRTMKKRKIH